MRKNERKKKGKGKEEDLHVPSNDTSCVQGKVGFDGASPCDVHR